MLLPRIRKKVLMHTQVTNLPMNVTGGSVAKATGDPGGYGFNDASSWQELLKVLKQDAHRESAIADASAVASKAK